jgi:hypothetical protein
MHFLFRASALLAALAIADPALAQQQSLTPAGKVIRTFPLDGGVPAGFMKRCGSRFLCYTGIPLQCADNTRPYQNISQHQCLCVRDGCPQ